MQIVLNPLVTLYVELYVEDPGSIPGYDSDSPLYSCTEYMHYLFNRSLIHKYFIIMVTYRAAINRVCS